MITIEDFKIKHTNKVRFIGLDLGSKRIGVSICDERQSIATPFKTINKTNTNELIDELKIIIKDNNIGGIIVGNPVNMDGSLGRSSKRIGVSICDERQSIATPFKTINKTNTNELIDELKIIIKDNNIGGIIVGNPVNMDGSLGRSAQSVNDVASNISKSIDLPVILWDERLSTVGAFNLSSLLDVNVSKRVKTIDQNAAAFILQGAIDFLNN